MEKLIKIPSSMDKHLASGQQLRVAAYCRVSTQQEEQEGSIKFQEQYYARLIDENPSWTNVGIFSERSTGLRLKDRTEFRAMMRLCRQGKIDLILTKSVSRFVRNTLDSIQVLRQLKKWNVDVYFEIGNLWLHEQQTEIALTMLFAIAQAESTSKSRDIKWGIRRGFQKGTSGYADFVCYGYKRGDDGQLAIDEPDAEIVHRIFQMRAEGRSLGAISDWLFEYKIPSPSGRERWSRETISKLLKNEKYTGDVLLQKTFVKDILEGKQVKNLGEMERFLIQGHHPAIVSRELFERVNEMGSDA